METKSAVDYVAYITDVLSKNGLDNKKLVKGYKRRFQLLSTGCRMKKTDMYKKYDEISTKIIGVFKAILAAPKALDSGNAAIVMYLLDDHINYLDTMKKRLSTVQTLELIQVGHEAVILKKEQLLEVLLGNLKRPITLDEFKDIMDRGDENENRSTDIAETRGKSGLDEDEGDTGGSEN